MIKRIIIWFVLFTGLAFANPPGTFNPLLLSASAIPIVTSYIGATVNTTGCTTCTLLTQNVGTAGTVSIVTIAFKMNAANTAISSVSVCGSSATAIIQNHPSDETVGIYAVTSAGSASCTVVVTFAAATIRGAVGYYRTANQSSLTPTDTAHCDTTTGAPTTCTTGTLTTGVQAGGNLIASFASDSGGNNTFSSSSGSMTTDTANAGAGGQTQSFGHLDSTTALSSITVTATGTGWGNPANSAVATFR